MARVLCQRCASRPARAGTGEPASSTDRGLCGTGQSGPGDRELTFARSTLQSSASVMLIAARRWGSRPIDPADLLKLYLYGYINQVRSSRRLEQEACRNLELIWLLRNLRPGYRTIANFRKENWTAMKARTAASCCWTRAWPCRRDDCCDRRLVLSWRCQQGEHLYAQEARRTDRKAGPGDRGLRHVD